MKIVCVLSPKYDFLTATLVEGLLTLGHTIIASEHSNYATKSSSRSLKKHANNADLIIAFSNKKVRLSLLHGIENPNKVFVDGSDSQQFSIPKDILFKAIFKRELNKFYINDFGEPIFPLPFAAEKRYFSGPKSLRDVNLSFIATLATNTLRYSVNQRLIKKNKNFYVGNTSERSYAPRKIIGLPFETPIYRDILLRSKISINVMGAGYDCARYWEILAAGALLLSQELEIQIPNEFTDGANCFTFSSLAEMDEKIDMLLDNPQLVAEVADAGFKHLTEYHLTHHRAQYFLDTYKEIQGEKFCESFYSLHEESYFNKFFSYIAN